MIGKIYITSSGYDPEHGKHINDPHLSGQPSLGACRPDIRKVVKPGDWIFTISGKLRVLPEINQFVMGAFQVAEKIDALDAYFRFPNQRLEFVNGQLRGNVIVDKFGRQHWLDQHSGGVGFERRIQNFIVGKNLVKPESPGEIIQAREQTMDVLQRVLRKLGSTPFGLIGRAAKNLNEKQVVMLLEWLFSLKDEIKIA